MTSLRAAVAAKGSELARLQKLMKLADPQALYKARDAAVGKIFDEACFLSTAARAYCSTQRSLRPTRAFCACRGPNRSKNFRSRKERVALMWSCRGCLL